ncbi:MAG: glycine cleavage system protein GcvH [Spirochaetes bacterium]|jgi:glycine cleavage system H protein|nr:glycine cleavage system protein GcvH [Spirochaetota bacterium]
MNFDDSVKYQKSHEWARKDGDLVVVGISDYAQDSLGDVVFVELPEVGATLEQGESFGVVESVKSASDLFMPVGGEIAEVNDSLTDTPETVNEAPFGDGWMIKIKPTDVSEYDSLMSAADYEEFTKTLEEE